MALLISTAPKLWPQRAAHACSNQNFKETSTPPPVTHCKALQDAKPPCVHTFFRGCVRACVRARTTVYDVEGISEATFTHR